MQNATAKGDIRGLGAGGLAPARRRATRPPAAGASALARNGRDLLTCWLV